jgi:hypothetical protein
LFTADFGPDEKNRALGLENVPRPSGSGRFQHLGPFSRPRAQFFSSGPKPPVNNIYELVLSFGQVQQYSNHESLCCQILMAAEKHC